MRMAEMKFKSKYRQAAVSGFKSFELITQHMETDGIQVIQMNIREVFEYIEQAGKYGIVPGLDSIRALCGKMGNPQKELRFVHIAGTNGKGSVSAYLASVLKYGGYRVGRFLSPVLFEYRERIQINDRPITKKALCEGMELIKKACEEMQEEGTAHPTPFEMETALGFWYFREKGCDIVILETGMGGLLDATNVVENTCAAVLTSISRDHMSYLGNTLSEIAAQKAGIIKKGCDVITAEQEQEVMEVISEKAAAAGCPVHIAGRADISQVRYGLEKQKFTYRGLKFEISLAGCCQIDNAAVALETLEVLREKGFSVAEEKKREGMAETRWPGRFTIIGRRPYFIVDGAHNADAAGKLAESLKAYFPDRRMIYILGVLKDKEYDKVIAQTHFLADQIITVTAPEEPRALPAYLLAGEAAKVHTGVTAADSLEEAVEMSYLLAGKEDVIVAFGSLSFLGRLMKIVDNMAGKGNGRK